VTLSVKVCWSCDTWYVAGASVTVGPVRAFVSGARGKMEKASRVIISRQIVFLLMFFMSSKLGCSILRRAPRR